MRVLIFGASGYIGKQATKRLLADGHSVTGFVRTAESGAAVEALGAQAIVASLDSPPAIAEALAEHDAAIWLVQLSLPEEQRVVKNLLEVMRRSGKAFIFTGGASVLSEKTGGEWLEKSYAETDSFTPRRELAIRADTENMVRIAGQTGVRAMVIRPPLVFGHGGCKVISDIYHSARKTGSACYVGAGRNVYSSVHVDDLAKLFPLALERGQAGALYHCVGGEASFRHMAQVVAAQLGCGTKSVTVEEAAEVWDRFTGPTVMSSCSRIRAPLARAELGWTVTPELSDILEDCAHPAYVAEAERTLASWVKPTTVGA